MLKNLGIQTTLSLSEPADQEQRQSTELRPRFIMALTDTKKLRCGYEKRAL